MRLRRATVGVVAMCVVLFTVVSHTRWPLLDTAHQRTIRPADVEQAPAYEPPPPPPTPAYEPPPPPPTPPEPTAPRLRAQPWEAWLKRLSDPSSPRYVIVDAKNGLGNRLRALCSSMSVASSLRRRVLLVWQPDLHCNCSFTELYKQPLPYDLLERAVPRANLSTGLFQVFNYMRPEPGAIKDEEIKVDRRRHLYFKSAFIMNHVRM
jgi:hypothetical protein